MNRKRKKSTHRPRTWRVANLKQLPAQLAELFYSASQKGVQLSSLLRDELNTLNLATLVSASVDPMGYTDADTFFRDYQAVELMSKFQKWNIGVDRAKVALDKWKAVETSCRAANSRISSDRNIPISVWPVLCEARRKITSVLDGRDISPLSDLLNELSTACSFTSGATTQFQRVRGDSAFKFGARELHCTNNLEPLVTALQEWAPNWCFTPVFVEGSRLTTVEKNAKTNRVICIEPDLNMFFQKGLGNMLRRRLHRVGLLVDEPGFDAQARNREAARQGSIDGTTMTVDLSSASDSLATEVVKFLLPHAWYEMIGLTRSQYCRLPSGELHFLHKVSSMGNGYTFELETLIFWALGKAVADVLHLSDRRVLAFGDDIIMSPLGYDLLLEVFTFLGFEVNTKKTHHRSHFRESCGGHYFAGQDVTPLYVKDVPQSLPELFVLANRIWKLSRMSYGKDSFYRKAYDLVIAKIPAKDRFPVPSHFPADSGLYSDFDEAAPIGRFDRHLHKCIFLVPCLRAVPSFVDGVDGTYRKSLFLAEFGTRGDVEDLRPVANTKYRKVVLKTSLWDSQGPWL